MTTLIQLILRFRWLLLATIAIATAGCLMLVLRAPVASSLGHLLFGDNPEYSRYLELSQDFGGDNVVMLAFGAPEPFSQANIEQLETLSERLSAIDYVGNVVTVLDAAQIAYLNDSLVIKPYYESVQSGEVSSRQAIRKMDQDPITAGLFFSKDAQYSAAYVGLIDPEDHEIPAEELPRLVDEMVEAVVSSGFAEPIYYAGIPAMTAGMTDESYRNIAQILPIAVLALFVFGFLGFGKLWPVLTALTVVGISAVWSTAFSLVFDPYLNMMATIVPAVVMVVGFADVVHLCSAFMQELRDGKSRSEATIAAGVDVGRACLVTSITTFIGFVAMAFVPNPMFQQLGWVLGFGVGMALVLAIILCPIIFMWLPERTLAKFGDHTESTNAFTQAIPRLAQRIIEGCHFLATRHPKAVVIFFVCAGAVMALQLKDLRIDADLNKRLDEDHIVRKSERFLHDQMTGTYLLDVYISNREGSVLAPKTVRAMLEIQQQLQAQPGVASTSSVANLLERVHRTMMPDQGPLPDTEAAMEQYLFLFSLSAPDALRPLISPDHRTAHISIRMEEGKVSDAVAIGQLAQQLTQQKLGEGFVAEPTGVQYLLGQWLSNIVDGQKRGLLFAIFSIALMMILATWSIRQGLWSMVPNLTPLFALGALCTWMWPYTDSDTMIVAMIAIGIGVDDTVHFLMRLRTELARNDDFATAMQKTFDFAGHGIVLTTLILVLGFLPVALSNYFSVAIMGTLLPFTLAVALAADLLLLPAMLQLGIGRSSVSRAR